MLSQIIPDGYKPLIAEDVIIKKEVCPKCKDEILLNKDNKYYYVCKCNYTWEPGLFGAIAIVPLKDVSAGD